MEVTQLQSALEESRNLHTDLTHSMDQLLSRLKAEKEQENSLRQQLAASQRELLEAREQVVRLSDFGERSCAFASQRLA
eukprot:3939493-Rhodomonas_salina.1